MIRMGPHMKFAALIRGRQNFKKKPGVNQLPTGACGPLGAGAGTGTAG